MDTHRCCSTGNICVGGKDARARAYMQKKGGHSNRRRMRRRCQPTASEISNKVPSTPVGPKGRKDGRKNSSLHQCVVRSKRCARYIQILPVGQRKVDPVAPNKMMGLTMDRQLSKKCSCGCPLRVRRITPLLTRRQLHQHVGRFYLRRELRLWPTRLF